MAAYELQASAELIQDLEELARGAYPEEACAAIIGWATESRAILETVLAARNVARMNRRRRFAIDPQVLLAAQKAARQRRNGIVAFFHSHPDHPATPSRSDRDSAWPGALHLIASVAGRGAIELAAYVLDASDGFRPVALTITGRLDAGVVA